MSIVSLNSIFFDVGVGHFSGTPQYTTAENESRRNHRTVQIYIFRNNPVHTKCSSHLKLNVLLSIYTTILLLLLLQEMTDIVVGGILILIEVLSFLQFCALF